MKKSLYNIFLTIPVIAAAALLAVSCNEKEPELRLDGDTWITAFSLDEFEGVIDRPDRTVTVYLPETYDASDMEVTGISVSEGAEASVSVGDFLNMNFPQTVTVTNGDAYMDFTVVVEHDYANILTFRLDGQYQGVIDQDNRTITVRVPTSVDVTSMIVDMTVNEGASVTPASGTAHDFTSPVEFTVTKNTATSLYTATVVKTDNPSAVYVGLESSSETLNPEEKAAVDWMLDNVPNSLYVSFDDIVSGSVDLSECKVMWWHLHIDGGIDTKEKFESAAPDAISAMTKIRDWWRDGGNLFLTRYATFYAAYIGAVADNSIPNNCWGQSEETGEMTTGPWSFYVDDTQASHPLYEGIETASDENGTLIYTCDAGYRITNSTAQWHLGTDWGGYADLQTWSSQTGGTSLGHGADGAVVAWEFPATEEHGTVLCIGSGCYDWYAYGVDASGDQYHGNVAKLTANAFEYLSEQ